MCRWNQVGSAADAGMRKDGRTFCEGGVAHERSRIRRREPEQKLTGRYEIGKVLGVDLGASVTNTGEIDPHTARR